MYILLACLTPTQATVGNVSADIGDVIIESSSSDSNRNDIIIIVTVLLAALLFLLALIFAVVVCYRWRLKKRMKRMR